MHDPSSQSYFIFVLCNVPIFNSLELAFILLSISHLSGLQLCVSGTFCTQVLCLVLCLHHLSESSGVLLHFLAFSCLDQGATPCWPQTSNIKTSDNLYRLTPDGTTLRAPPLPTPLQGALESSPMKFAGHLHLHSDMIATMSPWQMGGFQFPIVDGVPSLMTHENPEEQLRHAPGWYVPY